MAMIWTTLRRIADAVERTATTHEANQDAGAELQRLMEQTVANQQRTVEQYDRSYADAQKHRADCDQYHSSLATQLAANQRAWDAELQKLNERIAELERKAAEPWQ